MIRPLIFFLTGATTLLLASALNAAEVTAGRALAERWCSECHLIHEDQRRGNTEAPPFSEIAARPGFDAARIALALLVPHPPMVGLGLTRNEAANLAAYIQSQRQK